MFDLIAYKKEHVLPLVEQDINASIRALYKGGLAKTLESFTSVTGTYKGVPMVCGGVFKLWEGRACVWTVFNEQSKTCFVPVFRGIKTFLSLQLNEYRRLEITVPVDFEVGHRRALLLGFKQECALAKSFLPDGTDCSLYSMVRGN